MKCVYTFILLFVLTVAYSQPNCGFEEVAYTQVPPTNTFLVSDDNTNSTSAAHYIYDDFELSEEKNVDAICFLGGFRSTMAYTGREDETTRSLPICQPTSLDVIYYADNGSEPGNIIASFYDLTSFTIPDQNGLITVNHPIVNFPPGKYWLHIRSTGDGVCILRIAVNIPDNDDTVRRDQVGTRAVDPGVLTHGLPFAGYTPVGTGDGMYFNLRASAPIPTMGEWGIIILGISLSIIGLVAVRRENMATV